MAQQWAAGERAILQELDSAVRGEGVRPAIEAIAARVEAALAADPEAKLAWEPVPLEIYGVGLPAGIRSSWVFVLRAGTTSGAERHPNSHQRMMAWRGSGDLQTWEGNRWQSNLLAPDPAALKNLTSAPTKNVGAGRELHLRWVSIPVNVWHKPVMGRDTWAVVSFHTVPAHELIEERGHPEEHTATRQRTYL